MTDRIIEIYTDGSCHTQLGTGGWAAIVFVDGEKILLKGTEQETTHNRMELTAVIEGINYVNSLGVNYKQINICSDSQYVVNLVDRRQKLIEKQFLTKKEKLIPNADLVKILLNQIGKNNLKFIKMVAHQKENGSDNFNREVDKIARKIVRDAVNKGK